MRCMNKSEFGPQSPGRLVGIRLTDDLSVDGFIPDPLPPPLSLSMETAALLSRAENLLGRLDGITDALPDPSILVRAFIRREAAVSSYIEDTFAAYEDIGLVERDRETLQREVQAREVYNAERVIEFSIGAIRDQQRDITPSLLKEMHALLLRGVETDAEVVGDYRRKQVLIGKRSLGHQHARFVPPPQTFVPELVRTTLRLPAANHRIAFVSVVRHHSLPVRDDTPVRGR